MKLNSILKYKTLLIAVLLVLLSIGIVLLKNSKSPIIAEDISIDNKLDVPDSAGGNSNDSTSLPDDGNNESNSKSGEYKFEKPVTSFYLEGKDIEGMSLVVNKSNGTKSEKVNVYEFHDEFGEEEGSIEDHNENSHGGIVTSDLYSFHEGIESVDFFGSENKDFEVKILKQVENINSKFKMSSEVTTNYKRKFFESMGINVILREDWGAPTVSYWTPEIADVTKFVVHHTATSVNTSNPKSSVLNIYNFHYWRCSNNIGSYDPNRADCNSLDEIWNDIGYNYLIDPAGNIYEGRAGGNGTIGAHAGSGGNRGSIGIGMMGIFSNTLPTSQARLSLQKLIGVLSEFNDVQLTWQSTVYGHRNYMNTACPGQSLYDYLPTIVNQAKNYVSFSTTVNTATTLTDKLVKNQKYVSIGGVSRIFFDKTKLETDEASMISGNLIRGINEIFDYGDKTIMLVPDKLVYQLLVEYNLMFPHLEIQPDFIYNLSSWDNSDLDRSIPDDFDTNVHWNLEKMNVPETWKELGGCSFDENCGGDSSVKVAVIDSGVAYENYNYDAGGDYSTADIKEMQIQIPSTGTNSLYNEGYDRQYAISPHLSSSSFINPYDAAQKLICDLRDIEEAQCNSSEVSKIDHANDDLGHGTSVTTLIAGKTGDSDIDNIIGIAHNVSIIPIKVTMPNDKSFCYDSSGNASDICTTNDMRGVATTLTLELGIDHAISSGADILNMSLNGPDFDPVIEKIVKNAISTDIIVVSSTGNDGGMSLKSPAIIEGVIAVGAVNEDNAISSYSSRGSNIKLVAPVGDTGNKILISKYACTDCSDESNINLFEDFTTITSPGTSYAAAQITAIVALMKSKEPTLSDYHIKFHLYKYSTDLSTAGYDTNTGWGMPDIYATLDSINKIQICPTQLIGNAFPSKIDMSNILNEMIVLPNEYYIYQNERRETSEFDKTWITANCTLQKTILH